MTNNELQSTQAENQDIPIATEKSNGSGINDKIENLSCGTKVKKNSGTDFLTSKAKKAFRHLQKIFTKAPILRHFDLERHIRIETNASKYTISGVHSQMSLDQHFSDHVTYKANDQTNPRSENDQ